jgi:hypothetical protein
VGGTGVVVEVQVDHHRASSSTPLLCLQVGATTMTLSTMIMPFPDMEPIPFDSIENMDKFLRFIGIAIQLSEFASYDLLRYDVLYSNTSTTTSMDQGVHSFTQRNTILHNLQTTLIRSLKEYT